VCGKLADWLGNGEKSMAKECLIQKQKKLSAKWEKLHAEEMQILALPADKREEALKAFNERRIKNRMYRTRNYSRCSITGRPKGYSRYFGVCRQVLREMAHQGMLPGVTKSSW